MASQRIEERNLRPEHNVARYCASRKIIRGTPSLEAFMLRSQEDFLSTNWLEHFHSSNRQFQVSGVRDALINKGFRVNASGRFAVLNVGTATRQVRHVQLKFILLRHASDPSHAGIFGYQAGDADTAIALSKSVREVYPPSE